MEQLTKTEKKIYEFIKENIEREGYPPAMRDICAAVNISSTSCVFKYLNRLNDKGYIRKCNGKSRGIILQDIGESKQEKEDTIRVPLLGKVTAGIPITAIQNYEGYVDFPKSMSLGRSNLFALRIEGESMCEIGIMNGDIVVVEGGRYADNGDIVVAMIEDEATVKRFFKEPNRVRLQPENHTMKPIYARDVTILGKVIADFRFY